MVEVGEQIAGYRVEAVLGAGGMGEVYRVRHPRLPRSDALKVLRSAHADSPVVRARFEREADLVAPLTHPNLVRVYDRGVLGDELWIAMELVPGTDAARIISQSPGGLDVRLVANIVDAVASALDLAHRHGILHRDIKPANILITPGPDPITPEAIKVTDFGIAQALGDAAGDLTGTGTTVGTMRYCSPEQIDGRAVDGRADLYSLAATAFELLVGSTPFDSGSLQGLMSAHLFAEPPRASERNRSLSPAVDAVLLAGLAKDPAQRPPTCLAFAQALRTALFTGQTPIAPPSFANTPGAPIYTGAVSSAYTPGIPTGLTPLANPAPHGAGIPPWYRRTGIIAAAVVMLAAAVGVGVGSLWAASTGLDSPSGFSATSTADGVEMVWDSVPGASEYVVKQDGAEIATVSGTEHVLTAPLPGSHTYSVAARSTSKRQSDDVSNGPIDVTATWGNLGWIAKKYPDLIPATPVSLGGFEGLDCSGMESSILWRYPGQLITCTKFVDKMPQYAVRVFGFADSDRNTPGLAAVSAVPFNSKTEYNEKVPSGAIGRIETGVQDNESRSLFLPSGDDNRFLVMAVYYNPKAEKQARELLGRLPI